MRKAFFVMSLLVLGAIVTTHDSHAITYYNSGNSCIAATDNTSPGLQHGDNGSHNQSATNPLNVVCPFVGWESDTIDVTSMQVWAEDQSNNNKLSCYPRLRTYGDTLSVGSTLFLCATGGGCSPISPPADNWTGKHYLAWTDPFGAPAISQVAVYDVYCSLPNTNTGLGYSRVIRVSTTQVNP